MTLDDLDGRLFAEVPEAAAILGRDERTIRRAAAAGDIPATRVGKQYLIPTSGFASRPALPRLLPPPSLILTNSSTAWRIAFSRGSLCSSAARRGRWPDGSLPN